MNNFSISIDYDCILNQFCGNWIVQKSIFVAQKRQIYKYEKNIILKRDKKLDYIYIYRLEEKNIIPSSYIYLNKKYINKVNKLERNNHIYIINYLNCNILKISNRFNHSMIYNEYIYNISDNFNIVISILKVNNIYKSTSFTSYIRTYARQIA